jgi:hypothetical protein
MYVAWSYPAEANRDVTVLDNRFSTMTEVRRVAWPEYESPRYGDPLMFSQEIAGSLELFFVAWELFQKRVGELTGHAVPVFQRVDHAGYKLPLDERVLEDAEYAAGLRFGSHGHQSEAAPEKLKRSGNFLAARAPACFSGLTTTSE